ncbi:hypothetical protein MTO96_023260 [Rhipicephalus appendiculatus]
MAEASRVLIRSRSIDPAYLQFYGDDFLRLLMLRFIFCHVVLKLHRMFKIKYSVGDPENLYQRMPQAAMGTPPYQSLPGSNYLPRSHPPIPESEVLDHPALQRTILELAEVLDVRSLFSEIDEAD